MPLAVGTGCIDVNQYEDDIGRADFITDDIHPTAAFRKRNILHFRNETSGIVAAIDKFRHNATCDFAGAGVFTEEAIGTAFAWSFNAVPIVDKNCLSAAAYIFRQSPIPATNKGIISQNHVFPRQ